MALRRRALRHSHDAGGRDEDVDGRLRVGEHLLRGRARRDERAEVENECADVGLRRDGFELGDGLIELGLRSAGKNEQAGRVLDDRLCRLDGNAALAPSARQSARARTGEAPVMRTTLSRICKESADAISSAVVSRSKADITIGVQSWVSRACERSLASERAAQRASGTAWNQVERDRKPDDPLVWGRRAV